MLPQQEGVDGVKSDEAEVHSIRFAVDDWTIWQEPEYNPNDAVVVINQWRAGDTRLLLHYSAAKRLGWDDELHRLRMEFRQGDNVLLADTYAFADSGMSTASEESGFR